MFTTFFCFGQQQKIIIDSLHIIIQKEVNTDSIIKHYENTFYYLFDTQKEDPLIISKDLRLYAKTNKCNKCLAKAYYLEGYYHYAIGEYVLAIPKIDSVINIATKNNLKIKNKSIQLIIANYFSINQYDKAKVYAKLLTKKERSNKDVQNTEIAGYIFLGLINDEQNYYNLSVLNYNKADSLNNILKGPFYEQNKASIYTNLFVVFLKLKDFNKASLYLNKSNVLYAKDKTSEKYFLIKQNFAYLEIEKENYKEALDTLLKTKLFFKQNNHLYHRGEASYLLGRAYLGLKNYPKAIINLEESIEAFSNTGESINIGLCYKYLGDCYQYKKSNSKLSKIHFNNALQIFEKHSSLDNQISTLNSLSSLMEQNYNFKEALYYKKKKDSVSIIFQKQINQANTYQLETQYQTKKKDKEIELLITKNELTTQQKRNQKTILLSTISVITIAGLFFFFQYKNKQKTNNKLRELDEVKSNFFTNISHEFRTPLTLISGPIQKKLKEPNLSKEERSSLEMIHRNSSRLLSLVDQLLDISKLETGELHLSISKNKLLSFIGVLTENFNFSANQKNINYLCYINKSEATTWYDSDIIEKIVINLLSNAFKYTPENGSIVCNSLIKNNKFYFEIKNTGEGLASNELNKVFDKFYQINNHQQGAGIGLSLVKELVNLHKGTINAKSTLKEWTIFEVILPIGKNSYNETEISASMIDKKAPPIIINEKGFNNEEGIDVNTPNDNQPILLIVDDNKDIRDYIETIFKKSYSIIKAKDGQEGIEIALKQIPDIIISDIMMPIKNGIELCKQLKEDERTSHIPILLLTAKTGDENELEGIKTGVDDYITKPFNEELLTIKIENIIKSRKKLQERYSQEIILKPKEITINSVDEKFLHKIQKVLDNKLIESSFNIEEFSKSIGMSRMQLHRKLKALTGLSASEFIRSQRLKLAISLLENSDCNVSEIGYSVGFNNHAYFSKCFKETYKCSPTEYLESKK